MPVGVRYVRYVRSRVSAPHLSFEYEKLGGWWVGFEVSVTIRFLDFETLLQLVSHCNKHCPLQGQYLGDIANSG